MDDEAICPHCDAYIPTDSLESIDGRDSTFRCDCGALLTLRCFVTYEWEVEKYDPPPPPEETAG